MDQNSHFENAKRRLTRYNPQTFNALMAEAGVCERRFDKRRYRVCGQESKLTFRTCKLLDGDKVVYLKSVREDIDEQSKEKYRLKLLTEAIALAKLDGLEGVPKLYAIENAGDEFYLVIGEVYGQPILSSTVLCPNRVVRRMVNGATLLDEIHKRGVFHRDIEGPNIISSADKVSFIDFDCARVEGYVDIEEANGRFEGAEKNRAPERTIGNTTRTSEVYSLGSFFYKMISNIPKSDLRSEIEKILSKATAIKPEERYRTAE